MLARAGNEVRTYSLGFAGQEEQDWNELPLARMVAQKWGTTHQELVLDPESLLDDLLSMVWHLDEPYGGGLPSWTVFRLMSRDVKVGMTGTGGDELFGGYGKWRPLESGWLRRTVSRSVDRVMFRRKFFEQFYYLPDATKRAAVLHDSCLDATDTSDGLYCHFQQASSDDLRNCVSYVDLVTQLPEEFLMMTDRFSMAHSLEARTPFLDHEFVELALSVPGNMRMRRGNLKGLLRDTVRDLLPVELLSAPKKGFVIPLRLWLRDQLRPLIERLLGARQLQKQEVFKPAFYDAFVKPHLEGRADHTNVIWAALMYQLWQHLFIETQTPNRPAYGWKALLE
jgi:asparagine synthase (glutamine-hydrolysing)